MITAMALLRQIVTVTGPLDPARLGATDAHEHLFLESPAQPDDTMADLDRAVAELEEGRASGLDAVVELTPMGLGRRPDLLRAAAEATGVVIVAASGYHRDAHYPPAHWVRDASDQELAARVAADIRDGMDGTGVRAGVIKAGASLDRMSPSEERRLHAVAVAAIETGAPVVVHTEAGTAGPAIVDLLVADGVATERITLAHLDRKADPALHREIASRGVNLVYDTIGREKYGLDSARVALIEGMVTAGHGDRLMLGLDLGRRAYQRAYGGGPGMRHLMASFVPALRACVGVAAVERMLVANPARILAMPA